MLRLLSLLLLVDGGRAAPPPDGHFIVDATGTLRGATLADVDELASTIHVGGFGELMVLVVDSTGGVSAQRYGVDTFSGWPVGHAENVDGALLVVALRDQKAAVVLGDGYGRIAQKEVEELIAAAVTPALREGRRDDAVRDGAKAVLRLLEKHHPPVFAEEASGPEVAKASEWKGRPREVRHAPPSTWLDPDSLVGVLIQIVLPFLLALFSIVFIIVRIARRRP